MDGDQCYSEPLVDVKQKTTGCSELTLFHKPTILRLILVNICHEVKHE